MAVRAFLIDKESSALGEACALCKQPFAPGDELVICPEDSTRHHGHCWRANGNRCTAYGCTGRGLLLPAISPPRREQPPSRQAVVLDRARSKVRTLPDRSIHVAQSCLILAIALSIVLIAVSCFGLWAIADFIMMELLGWQYRPPLVGFTNYNFPFTIL